MGETFRKDLGTLPDSARDYFIDQVAETQINIAPYQTNVVINTMTTDFNLIMPPVAECKGVPYTITLTTATTNKTATLKDYGVGVAESIGWTNLAFAASGDWVQLKSDGVHWVVVENGIA